MTKRRVRRVAMIDKRYLNWKSKIGYGAGDVAGNVVYAFLSTFMMFYLTDTMGMNVGIVGILMAVSRLLDALTDLLFGNLLDRTSTRMGKARPWMLLGYIGCAVMLAAIFMIPSHWGDAAKYAYFFITYTLLNAVFYTVNNIAYATLTALITKNTSERVQLGSIRYMFAFAATMIIQTATMDLVSSLGGGAAGWKIAAIIYAVIGLIVNTISCLCVKELPVKDLYTTDLMEYPQPEKTCSMAEGFHLLFSNKFYLMICGIYLMSQLCQSSLNMGVYYMKYVLGNEGLLKTFSLYTNVPLILGLIITPILVKKLRGMYKLNLVGYAIASVGRLGMMICAYFGSIPMMLVFTAISAIGASPMQGSLNALIASCSEYTFLTKGRRIDGTLYACSSFGIKVGASIGTAISGWLMASAGYVENAAVQTSSTINMLHVLYLWAPVILNIGITALLSKLDVEKENEKVLAKTFQAYLDNHQAESFL